jgi:hypothetical protein
MKLQQILQQSFGRLNIIWKVIGITLTAEQIRVAPADVRRWIEQQVVNSLGLQVQSPNAATAIERLAGCSLQELNAMLSLVQGVFPAVNVLFELGRSGVNFAQEKLVAFRLSDIQHHTRLQSVEHVVACLDLIDEALQRVRGGTKDIMFYGLDSTVYCFITNETQQNIHRLWQDMIGRHGIAAETRANDRSDELSGASQPAFNRAVGQEAFSPSETGVTSSI